MGNMHKLEGGPMGVRQCLSLSDTELPQVKDWKVGKKYRLEVEVEQTGLHEFKEGKRGEFVVRRVRSLEDGEREEMGERARSVMG